MASERMLCSGNGGDPTTALHVSQPVPHWLALMKQSRADGFQRACFCP
jgi:hypothetical protein